MRGPLHKIRLRIINNIETEYRTCPKADASFWFIMLFINTDCILERILKKIFCFFSIQSFDGQDRIMADFNAPDGNNSPARAGRQL